MQYLSRLIEPVDSRQVRRCGAVPTHPCGSMTILGAYSMLPNSVAFPRSCGADEEDAAWAFLHAVGT
jgi:hypothetical protein